MTRPERIAPDDGAHQAWAAMRALVLDNERRKEACDALGMSFLKVKALRYLMAGPLTMRELTARLVTDAPYLTIVVDDLERRGLVERSVLAGDRRSKRVSLTPEGAAAAQRAESILGEPPASFAALDEAESATLVGLLGRLADAEQDQPRSMPG